MYLQKACYLNIVIVKLKPQCVDSSRDLTNVLLETSIYGRAERFLLLLSVTIVIHYLQLFNKSTFARSTRSCNEHPKSISFNSVPYFAPPERVGERRET